MATNLSELIRQIAFLKGGGGRKGLAQEISEGVTGLGQTATKFAKDLTTIQKTKADISLTKAKRDAEGTDPFVDFDPTTGNTTIPDLSKPPESGILRIRASQAASPAARVSAGLDKVEREKQLEERKVLRDRQKEES